MTTTSQGVRAEQAVTDYLKLNNYIIIDRNWKTRFCEIDIIAKKDATVLFIEVKYRRTLVQGDGLEYITPKKLRQMSFASDIWASNQNYSGDRQLMAAAVSGDDCQNINLVEIT